MVEGPGLSKSAFSSSLHKKWGGEGAVGPDGGFDLETESYLGYFVYLQRCIPVIAPIGGVWLSNGG